MKHAAVPPLTPSRTNPVLPLPTPLPCPHLSATDTSRPAGVEGSMSPALRGSTDSKMASATSANREGQVVVDCGTTRAAQTQRWPPPRLQGAMEIRFNRKMCRGGQG